MRTFNPEEFLILVVDDVSQNLQVVGSILDEVGYGTTFATTGEQAIKRVKTAKPDLILLDLMMPEMNGLEVCEILKSDPINQEIPIIFLTASNEKDDLIEAFREGAVDYLTKPFSVPELLTRVRTHLELQYTKNELKKALNELEKLVTTDSLTGSYNRGQLFKLGEQELEKNKLNHKPLSILLMNVDHLKKINDLYSYNIGDQVLSLITKTTFKTIRNSDFFGRIGGGKFVIILPETSLEEAAKIAEQLHNKIAEISLIYNQESVFFTVSIATTISSHSTRNFESLLQQAEQVLYQAKNQSIIE